MFGVQIFVALEYQQTLHELQSKLLKGGLYRGLFRGLL